MYKDGRRGESKFSTPDLHEEELWIIVIWNISWKWPSRRAFPKQPGTFIFPSLPSAVWSSLWKRNWGSLFSSVMQRQWKSLRRAPFSTIMPSDAFLFLNIWNRTLKMNSTSSRIPSKSDCRLLRTLMFSPNFWGNSRKTIPRLPSSFMNTVPRSLNPPCRKESSM